MNSTLYLTRREISFFAENMAMMLKSGIASNEAVEILCEDMPECKMKIVMEKLAADVHNMYSLHKAVVASGSFPKYFVDMVEIGEITGKLDSVFSALAKYYEKENNMNMRIRSAVIYPVVIVTLMSAVVFFLVFNVMPIFAGVYESLGTSMVNSAATSINIGFSLGYFALYGVIAILAVTFGLLLLSATDSGRKAIAKLLEKLWFTKRIVYQIHVSRLAYALSTFISSGIDTDRAMELSMNMITHGELHDSIEKCVEHMKNGDSLANAMAKEKIFGSIYGRMFVSSMKTGSQDEVMSRLADIYDEETSESLDNIISSIAPISVIGMTVIVGVVLSSVMIPLVGIMSSMG